MLKALPSEASDSTRPCSTSPRGLCSFNDRRRGRPRRQGSGAAAVPPSSLLPGTRCLVSRVNPASTLPCVSRLFQSGAGLCALRGGVGSRGCLSGRSSGPCRHRSPLPPRARGSAPVLSCLLSSVRSGQAWVPLGCGSAGRDVQAEGWAQGQFGEAAALPSCWVCSCVVLPICLCASTASLSLIEEPWKPGCWSLVLGAGSISGGLRPCTVGTLSSDWPVLLPPGLALSPGGPGSCQSELGQAPSGELMVCHCSRQPQVLSWLKPDCATQSLGPCSCGSPRTQSPCPSPGPRGCPIGLLPCRPLHPGTCPRALCAGLREEEPWGWGRSF